MQVVRDVGWSADYRLRTSLSSQFTLSPVNRPIGAHFHSGGGELSNFGEDLDEAFGEPEKPIASTTVRH